MRAMRASSLHVVIVLSAAALLLPQLARADLYGFVDERGVTHFSNYPVDSRYYLFKKDRKDPGIPGSNLKLTSVPHQSRPSRTIRVDPAQRNRYASLIAEIARRKDWYRLRCPRALFAAPDRARAWEAVGGDRVVRHRAGPDRARHARRPPRGRPHTPGAVRHSACLVRRDGGHSLWAFSPGGLFHADRRPRRPVRGNCPQLPGIDQAAGLR